MAPTKTHTQHRVREEPRVNLDPVRPGIYPAEGNDSKASGVISSNLIFLHLVKRSQVKVYNVEIT